MNDPALGISAAENGSPIPKTESPLVVDLTALPAVECPCGQARRAFADRDDFPGTVHLTQIEKSARTHYHKDHTEVYVILECEPDAAMELDGRLVPVKQKTSILIPPGTRHRAVGQMQVLILCLPKFDSSDEHFD